MYISYVYFSNKILETNSILFSIFKMTFLNISNVVPYFVFLYE
jgi:hypothetical protein